jgi:hypothetical protein
VARGKARVRAAFGSARMRARQLEDTRLVGAGIGASWLIVGACLGCGALVLQHPRHARQLGTRSCLP